MTNSSLRGVFFVQSPSFAAEGAGPLGEGAILKVTMTTTLKDLQRYELREESKPFREWCIPSEILNGSAKHSTCPIETGGPEPIPENYEAYVVTLRKVNRDCKNNVTSAATSTIRRLEPLTCSSRMAADKIARNNT